MKCHGCLKPAKDLYKIKCSAATCSKQFCCLCINLSGMSSEQKNNWKCPDCCASQRRGGDNSSTPIRPTEDNITLRKKSDTTSDPAACTEVKELISEVRLLTQEISSLKKQLENAISSLSSCEKRLDELGSAIASNDSRITQLEVRDQQADIIIKTTVRDLNQELNMQAQNYLRNELELSGIPETTNENLFHIALLSARKIGVDLDDRDIDWVSRVGPRKPAAAAAENKYSRPVVVRLLRKAKRDEIIKAAKTRRNVTSADYDFPGPSQKVFYNERLTKLNRELFREARSKAKQLGFAHCWCSQGTIFVRKHEGKPARPVRTYEDLAGIFSLSGVASQ